MTKPFSNNNGFFITTDGKLERSHIYFSQVQLEMLANGKRFCDFVVFTNAGLHIDNIPFDQQFCEELVEVATFSFISTFSLK